MSNGHTEKHNMQPSARQWYILFYGRTFHSTTISGTQKRISKQPTAEQHFEKQLNERYIIKVDKHINKDVRFCVCQKLYCSE